MQSSQGGVVESCADLAGVDQVCAVVVAEQQRAESDPAALWGGVPDDHELLVAAALELQPVPRTPALVVRFSELGDHAFVPALARGAIHRLTVGDTVCGVAQRIFEPKAIAQQTFTQYQ